MRNNLILKHPSAKNRQKRKLKLAFEELEREMAAIGRHEQLMYKGGGSGSSGFDSSGFTIEGFVDYMRQNGFVVTQDSNGNYYSEGYLVMDPVMVYASYGGSGWNGSSGSGYYYYGDSGYNSGTGGDGGGGGYFSALYTSYFQTYGPQPVPTPEAGRGPWTRDSDGNIVAIPSDTYIIYEKYDISLYMQQVTLTTTGGDVIAYKVLSASDLNGNVLPLDEKYMANCYGSAFADGDYWFIDNEATQFDEFTGFTTMLSSYYESTTNLTEASLAIVYVGSQFSHAGQYNPTTGAFHGKGGGKRNKGLGQ
ncbi:hypothetical protein [Niabella drilacis]|uniref:Uncharacterized protein n=1 Tax=Niabella drilacis (strain DSM 25811 / CCM 8410 / CCUG 62505 / LMG 26954 / E90) TaxID=1285928 RepID=A0A1G6V3L1_NIADE|nr:hypothetical protein [Niabella drilacis]SDD47557.1 hypothetical protein SAMN04487894_109164 [Niabella drilacis]